MFGLEHTGFRSADWSSIGMMRAGFIFGKI
jgi:hypothetical protein